MRDRLEKTLTTTTYTCRSCGYMQLATVSSVGYGVGIMASENAHRDAQSAVPMLLALANCPRCGRRDEGVAAHNRRTRTIAMAAIAIIGALFSLGLFVVMPLSGLVCGGVMALTYVWLRKVLLLRYPTQITTEVTFSDLPQPDWHPVPQQESQPGWKWI